MLAEKNESIKEGIVTLKQLSEDEKLQLECEARERYRMDMSTATSYGYKQGHEEGLEQMSKLVTLLLNENKIDDLAKASEDEEYRNQLFAEYNL